MEIFSTTRIVSFYAIGCLWTLLTIIADRKYDRDNCTFGKTKTQFVISSIIFILLSWTFFLPLWIKHRWIPDNKNEFKEMKEELKRIPGIPFLLRLVNPSYSYCEICGLPWNHTENHTVQLNKSVGCFAVCEYCHQHASKGELMDAYKSAYKKYWRDSDAEHPWIYYEQAIEKDISNRDMAGKDLILRDISARLPYKVKVQVEYSEEHASSFRNNFCKRGLNTLTTEIYQLFQKDEITLKPYFRQYEDMTEDESHTYFFLQQHYPTPFGDVHVDTVASIDYLNKCHIDYRGMIEQDLALKATKDMYKEQY